jgi:hypothetical protein
MGGVAHKNGKIYSVSILSGVLLLLYILYKRRSPAMKIAKVALPLPKAALNKRVPPFFTGLAPVDGVDDSVELPVAEARVDVTVSTADDAEGAESALKRA